MGQVIAAIQQKGGVGKSAMLNCLAGSLARDGAKVLLLDTDPQQSSVQWAEKTELDNVSFAPVKAESELMPILSDVRDKFDAVLIDTAGFDSMMAVYAIQGSDLILVPTNASEKDVLGAVRTWQHVQSLTQNNKTPPEVRIVMWKVNVRTAVYSHAKTMLKHDGAPLLPGAVQQLVGFDNMAWKGGLPDGRASVSVGEFMAHMQQADLLTYYTERMKGAA